MTPAAPVYLDLEALAAAVGAAPAKQVVLTNGCFDPLHVGHVRYLEDAKRHGDYLVVAVNGDAGTRRIKGEGRPVVVAADRARIVAALRCVDAVLLFDEDSVAAILERLRPAVHAKGTDYRPETVPEFAVSERLGIRTVVAGDAKAHASREIVTRVRAAGRGGSTERP
jgi:D-glycero-beta-D-manno-heptose 1-phosphate adenylyltransferase